MAEFIGCQNSLCRYWLKEAEVISRMKRVFFSVGEPSGDIHGANLIRDLEQLDPTIECVGFGGPKMAEAGCKIHYDLTRVAVMFIASAISQLRLFYRLVGQANRYFAENQVDAVVLIDFSGFNWWIARKAKANGITVYYYGVPQLWAWAPWRIRKIKKYVDHVLSKLSFETEWYQRNGCNAVFVGHPYFDEIARQKIDTELLARLQQDDTPLVTLLPGSRNQEVTKNLPTLIKAAQHIAKERPKVRFAIAAFNDRHQRQSQQVLAELTDSDSDSKLKIEVYSQSTPELIQASHSCIACSGSVSLELMNHLKPTVIQYRVNSPIWVLQGIGLRVQFITLVNLLWTKNIKKQQFKPFDPDAPNAEPVPFPEYMFLKDPSKRVANHVIRWLSDEGLYQQKVSQLEELRLKCAQTGTSKRVAAYITENLGVEAEKSQDALSTSEELNRKAG